MKKTVVIGASPNPARYSYLVTQALQKQGYPVVALGFREGKIGELEIRKDRPSLKDVDTVTLYLSEKNQGNWEDYILSLQPKRILFNPGAHNPEFSKRAASKGIETENACTLVLLSTGGY